MMLLTADQIDRVFRVIDSLLLDRAWITVPAPAAEVGSETLLSDGQVLICAPFGTRFDAWFRGLRERLVNLGLARVRRAEGTRPPRSRNRDPRPILEMTGFPAPPGLGLETRGGDIATGGRRRGDPGVRPLTLDEVISGGVPDRADSMPAPAVEPAQDVGGEG